MVPSSKSSRMAKNNQKWEPYKEEIRRTYLEENNKLEFTMEKIEKDHGFKARSTKTQMLLPILVMLIISRSERTWKKMLKEWGFEKYLNNESMKFILAKTEKRVRDEGKETVFFHGDNQVTEERIEGFKKRKFAKEEDGASPSIGETEKRCRGTRETLLIINRHA